MLKFENSYPMNQLTTLQIGGPAKKFVAVKTQEELLEAIRYAKRCRMRYLVMGGGSNLLVSDEGVNSLVIKNEITGISTSEEPPSTTLGTRKLTSEVSCGVPQAQHHLGGVTLKVKSGTFLQELVDYTIHYGFSGLQKLAGIPGTVGGAVYGNAGAYGQTISDCIMEIIAFDGSKIVTLSKKKCNFNYRDSIFKINEYTILEVKFQLKKGNSDTLQQEATEVLRKRLIKYPPGIKCPGSFFKNIVAKTLPKDILNKIPPGKIVYGKLPAGALLEEVGAKKQSLDGIKIASYHANLFINKGGGNAKAFCSLARIYALKVKEKFDIALEPEVQLINLPPLV